MPSLISSVTVSVPATSANLGPGFDVLGLALAHYEEVTVSFGKKGPPVTVRVSGVGTDGIPCNEKNLAFRAVVNVFKHVRRRLPPVTVSLTVRLPVAGGLGSSSAAIVGGLVAANHALGNPLTTEDLVDMSTAMEGHPDNVTPALVGGLCMARVQGGHVTWFSWKNPGLFKGLTSVACVPALRLETEKARQILPTHVPRADAVFNTANTALFLGALRERNFKVMGQAMDDRLHQPYRAACVPGLMAVIQSARQAGAYGAALSGAGPTVLALVSPEKAKTVGGAMERSFAKVGLNSISKILRVDTRGARVVKS